MLKYKLPLFLLISTPVFASTPCDYKVDDVITYQGKIDSVKLISESIEAVSYTHLTLPTSDLV